MQDSLNPSSELSYNRGNLLYRSKMLDESLKSYREHFLKILKIMMQEKTMNL